MPLSLSEMLGMRLRGTPVLRMRRCLERAEAAGLDVNSDLLEAHFLAGGNAERVLEAMLMAQKSGIEPDWMRLSAFDLSGSDPVEVVQRSLVEHELFFDQYAPSAPEKILGYCKDRSAVRAACRIVYRLPLVPDATPLLNRLQERLSARIAVLINTAESPRMLEALKSQHETGLLALAHEALPTAKAVHLRFAAVHAQNA